MSDLPERDIFALSTAFALGECTQTELEQLYSLLQEDGENGRQAAQIAWQALAIHGDLRAKLGEERFRHSVELRIDDQKGSFFRSVMRRLAWAPSPLKPVPLPAAPVHKRHFLALSLILSCLLGLMLFLLIPTAPVIELLDSQGVLRHDGRRIAEGSSLQAGILSLGEESWAHLRSPQGQHIEVRGPAQLILTAQNLAASNGALLLQSSDSPLTLGTPEGQVLLDPQSRVQVLIRDGHVSIGVAQGRALLDGFQQRAPMALAQGMAFSLGQSFPWRSQDVAEDSEAWLIGESAIHQWQAEALWHPARDASLFLYDQKGQLICEIATEHIFANGQSWPLSPPPLRERRLRLSYENQQLRLSLSGGPRDLQIASGTPQLLLQASRETGRLEQLRWWSGPKPWERPLRPSF